MSTVERYDENGEAIFATEEGPLKNLWKYLSIINETGFNDTLIVEGDKFDCNEFFKRLYLSRAELDVINSVLKLLLKEGDCTITLEALPHENVEITMTSKFPLKPTNQVIYGLKRSFLREISKDLKDNSDNLKKNREQEHVTITGILLKLREEYRWNLVRLSSPDQIQVTLNYQEMTPVIGIDYSPSTLFKDITTNSEQRNYKLSHQIGSESLALVVRNKEGKLILLFQSRTQEENIVIKLNNLVNGEENQSILLKKGQFSIELNEENDNLNEWNEALKQSRNRLICQNIMKLLIDEIERFPMDTAIYEEKMTKIIIEEGMELTMKMINDNDDNITDNINIINNINNNENSIVNIYFNLLREYLSSSGKQVNWKNIRAKLIQ